MSATQPETHFLASPQTAALLDLDPDLGAALDSERLALARPAMRARTQWLARGASSAQALASLGDQAVGLLVVEGILAREFVLDDTVSTELLGPGDFFRANEAGDAPLVGHHVRFQVLADARLALLGAAFARVLPHFPEVNSALLERAFARAQRLTTTQ